MSVCYPYLSKHANAKARVPIWSYIQILMVIVGAYLLINRPKIFPQQAQEPPSAFGGQQFGMLPPLVNTPTLVPTATPWATHTPTPIPTATEEPQRIGDNYQAIFIFKYSYYNPKLGGVNCANFDYALNDCISMMADGDDYHNYYGLAVACPPEIALGTKVEVIYPASLKGKWICKDRGGAIVGDYIDFLDLAQRYTWSDPVVAYLTPPKREIQEYPGTH